MREGDSLRKICRDLGLNRKTVKHYITAYFDAKKQSKAAGTAEILHRSVTEAPGYHCKEPRPKKKQIPALIEAIDGFLADNDRKVRKAYPSSVCLKRTSTRLWSSKAIKLATQLSAAASTYAPDEVQG